MSPGHMYRCGCYEDTAGMHPCPEHQAGSVDIRSLWPTNEDVERTDNRLAEHEQRFDAIREQVAKIKRLLEARIASLELTRMVRDERLLTDEQVDRLGAIIGAHILASAGNGGDFKHANEACDLTRTTTRVWTNQDKVIEAAREQSA